MKYLGSLFLGLICMSPIAGIAADDPNPIPRVSVFSTSTDWEAVTGLRLSVFNIEIIPDYKLIGNIGLELYYLDGFPCYGQTDRTNVWIGPKNQRRDNITAVCLYAPGTVYLAWRNTTRDALQDKTLGILECPNTSKDNITIDLSKCVRGKEWQERR